MKYEKIIEEFKKRFINIGSLIFPMDGSLAPKFVEKEKEVIEFITSTISKRDEAIREMVEGMKFEDSAQAGQFAMHADGYNEAIDDLLAKLSEE